MKMILLIAMFMVVSVGGVYAVEPSMAAKRQEARQEFKAKLEKLKDERKKVAVERINTKMCELQKKRVATMTANLGKMTEVLAKVNTKSADLPADKKATVTSAVSSAQAALAEAKSAVAAQEAKKCDLVISGSDQTVKTEVNSARLAFEASLRATHEKVTSARKAVSAAVKALAVATGEKL